MKKILLLLLLPIFSFGQINTFPWIHDFDNSLGLEQEINYDGDWTEVQKNLDPLTKGTIPIGFPSQDSQLSTFFVQYR